MNLKKQAVKQKLLAILLMLAMPVLFTGCEDPVDTTDSGGILLVTEINGAFPFRVSVNTTDRLIVDNITVNSIVSDPLGVTSSLMDVTLETMQVSFTRADGGSRVPPPLVRNLLARVPVGGVSTLSLTVMTFEQLRSEPASDLLFENGGFDSETGRTNIKMNMVIQFFGETLSGKEVVSEPRSLTLELVQ